MRHVAPAKRVGHDLRNLVLNPDLRTCPDGLAHLVLLAHALPFPRAT